MKKDRWAKPRELTKDEERDYKYLSNLVMNHAATWLEKLEHKRLHRHLVLRSICEAEEVVRKLERDADVSVN